MLTYCQPADDVERCQSAAGSGRSINVSPINIKGLQVIPATGTAWPHAPYHSIGPCPAASRKPWVTLNRFTSLILLLPERKFLNIIPAHCRNFGNDVHRFGLMFCGL
jgi:hypothetical protein